MNLQFLLYHLSFLLIYFPLSKSTRNKDLVTLKTGLAEISPCSVGLQLYAVLNNSADEDYFVELKSDECCITNDEDMDCDSIDIIGECSEVIQKGNGKTFTLVAPVLDPYERNGYCIIHVDSRPIDKRNYVMRDTITIDFDTMLENIADINSDLIKKCKNIDEDPLNDCKPVNCDIYYNGIKPIFDENSKRCIEVPKCRSKKSEASNVYDPKTNKCKAIESIDNDDVDFLTSLNKDRQPKDIIIVESPDDIVKTCLIDANSAVKGNVTQVLKSDIKRKYVCENLMQYLMENRYTLLVFGIVSLGQCCFICVMVYCLTKRSVHCEKKKVKRKYFNYRQDVSVTTPLIATSNIDTETALDYITESSNVEKKIKCYKSCQKAKKNDAKVSMSDDILTKCLYRRDWNTKPKSAMNNSANTPFLSFNPEWKALHTNIKQNTVVDSNVEDTKEKATETETKKEREYKEDYSGSDSSEKFIKCHNYNFVQTTKIGTDNFERKAPSMSTEKGAQACFSNDSIDDFLSERGMAFLAGDRLSKYSFSSNSSSNRTGQSNSSKTSKNRNIVKSVLSYLSKKSKKYTSSEPGLKVNKGTDLELIHMSKASMFSSSASDYKNIQGVKLGKDSRSTF